MCSQMASMGSCCRRVARGLSDALLRLLRDPALARQMARSGRRRVENEFSSRRMASRYEDIYRRCLIARGHAAHMPRFDL